MVLSNVEIHKALDSGSLIINPEPSPRFPTLDDPDCPYDTTAVDLSLGIELAIPKGDKPFVFDLRKGSIAKFLSENCRKVSIDPDGGFCLQPQQFVLGKTVERVGLPIREGCTLAARVEGRSSFARCGLLVHFSAPTIHAGFEGTITLEMMNLGIYPIMLYEGLHICQLIVERVDGTPQSNPSEFHSQSTPTGL